MRLETASGAKAALAVWVGLRPGRHIILILAAAEPMTKSPVVLWLLQGASG